VDDVTVVLDMTGSRSLGKLQKLSEDGRETRGGFVLDYEGSFGRRYSIAPPHFLWWMPGTRRLYVQLKRLGGVFGLVKLGSLQSKVTAAMLGLAELGLYSYEPLKVSRVDVAVDLRFDDPSAGKRLLEALHAAAWSDGYVGRLEYATTVNVRRIRPGRKGGRIAARSYCRGTLHPELAAPHELVRLERERHFKADAERPAIEELTPERLSSIWLEVYGGVGNGEKLATVPMEELTMSILERVKAGEMGVAQAERVRFFLELERLGLARDYYSQTQYRARRAEARQLGITVEDALVSALDVELGELLRVAASGLEPGEAVPA
jgi:hypothetical protein